jgi:hypothetical protein
MNVWMSESMCQFDVTKARELRILKIVIDLCSNKELGSFFNM